MTRTSEMTSQQRFRPFVEGLEERYCPAAPVVDLQVEYLGGATIRLHGTVQDESPSTVWLYLSGPLSGLINTINPNQDGTFSLTTEATGAGTVTAFAMDNEYLMSNWATAPLTSDAPTITNFTAVRQSGNFWLFSGTVTDEDPEGLIVQFGGLMSLYGKTATVGADGTFSVCFELQSDEQGIASAWVTDWFGFGSNYAEVIVYPS